MASKYILGISAFYHDSAAAIIKDGEIIAAAQEERFSRKKHDPRFPVNAINYCLEEAFIEPDEISAVAFYDNPALTWDRIVKSCIVGGKESSETFESAFTSLFGIKMWVHDHVKKLLGTTGELGKIVFTGHHMSHSASCFYPSPFKESAILTLDGVGEWSTTTIAHGKENQIDILKEINFPNSLGLLYSAFTYYCGFKVNSGEYKLMGLAPYGRPIYADKIYQHLIDVKDDGSYSLNQEYFGFIAGKKSISQKFCDLFGGPERLPESRITRREMDLAASIQKVTEEVMIRIAKEAKKITGSRNLCLAGGVALNCVANGKILKEKIFDNIWIQPAAGDAGGALGAAMVAHHQVYKETRKLSESMDSQKGTYLGPKFSNTEIQAYLKRKGYPAHVLTDKKLWAAKVAEALAAEKIVGFFSGRMEFGPRSLGARSIIGDARSPEMQSDMNLKIKFRESFRPFAPAVLEDDVQLYFDLETSSPYMLLVAPVQQSLLKNIENDSDKAEDMIEIINQVRSEIPAVTHVDNSARVQTVHKETNLPFYTVIEEFKNLTGSSVLVNTSFNVRGEPIVCTPEDAYKCFMRTNIDVLVLEDAILYKEEQPEFTDLQDWQEEFQLD
ncbi:MAG: carbamoyltransferase [Chitinophagaceae bacterium]